MYAEASDFIRSICECRTVNKMKILRALCIKKRNNMNTKLPNPRGASSEQQTSKNN